MKRILVAATAFLALSVPASATGKAPIEGRWKNGRMEIVIAPCGNSLCGTVVKASAKAQAKAQRGSGTELIGARLIRNIRLTGPSTYKANVYLPDRDMNARGTIRQVSEDRLAVRGCALVVICKSATWERISR